MARRLALVAVVTAALAVTHSAPPYDLLIKNGRVVDGTGSPWFRADVAVRGDAIAAFAPSIHGRAARTIDASGQIVAPGFIDIHTHARRGIVDVPTAANYIRQGVTMLMEGPDGSSPLPLAPYLAQLEGLAKSPNIGLFVGQGPVRSSVVGNVNRRATGDEPRHDWASWIAASCAPG